MKNLILILICACAFTGSILVGNGVTQSFQHLYARDIQFENPGLASILLTPGTGNKSGLTTVTLPDGTGTIVTSYNNYSFLMTALKALDAAHGSHSGINWISFGY